MRRRRSTMSGDASRVLKATAVEHTPVPAKVLRKKRRGRRRRGRRKRATAGNGQTPDNETNHNVSLTLCLRDDTVHYAVLKPYNVDSKSFDTLSKSCFRIRILQRCTYSQLSILINATTACKTHVEEGKDTYSLAQTLASNLVLFHEIQAGLHILWAGFKKGESDSSDLQGRALNIMLPFAACRVSMLLLNVKRFLDCKDLPCIKEIIHAGNRFVQCAKRWATELQVFCVDGARATVFSTVEKSYMVEEGICVMTGVQQCRNEVCALRICEEIAALVGIPFPALLESLRVALTSIAKNAVA